MQKNIKNNDVTLETGDLEIGAVELKDATTATRMALNAANTARTTATVVMPTQAIDATGKVTPAGEVVGNAPFVAVTDGTNTATVDAANTARTTGTVVQATQNIGANGGVMPSGATASDPIHVSTGGVVASTMGQGRQIVTTPATAVALAGSTAIKEVTITAETNNTDVVTIGGSGVIGAEATRQGTPLYPGDSMTIKSDNLSEVYIDAIVATEGVSYSYLA